MIAYIKAMSILQTRPNDIFPFSVKGRAKETAIKVGSTYDLTNNEMDDSDLSNGRGGRWRCAPERHQHFRSAPIEVINARRTRTRSS